MSAVTETRDSLHRTRAVVEDCKAAIDDLDVALRSALAVARRKGPKCSSWAPSMEQPGA